MITLTILHSGTNFSAAAVGVMSKSDAGAGRTKADVDRKTAGLQQPTRSESQESEYEKPGVTLAESGARACTDQRVSTQAMKRRKCILGSLTCLFIITVIALSVGLSVGLAVRNGSK
jgi:hypothetical protein